MITYNLKCGIIYVYRVSQKKRFHSYEYPKYSITVPYQQLYIRVGTHTDGNVFGTPCTWRLCVCGCTHPSSIWPRKCPHTAVTKRGVSGPHPKKLSIMRKVPQPATVITSSSTQMKSYARPAPPPSWLISTFMTCSEVVMCLDDEV